MWTGCGYLAQLTFVEGRPARRRDPTGVAVVDDRHARVEGRRNDGALVRVREIGGELDDEGPRRRRAHAPEEDAQLRRLPAPLVDEGGVGRGDVELDEVGKGREALDERDVVVDRLASDGDDQRDPVGQPGQYGAVGVESWVLEAVAVDEARSLGRPAPHEVRLR